MKLAKWMMTVLFACGLIFAMSGCGASESDICEAAKSLVSEQCARMNSENPATCVSVTLTKKISDDCWTAQAKLDNGNTIPIVIKVSGDQIEVDFSAWLKKEIDKEIKKAGEEMDKELKKAGEEMDKEIKKAGEEMDKEIKKAGEDLDKELKKAGADLD